MKRKIGKIWIKKRLREVKVVGMKVVVVKMIVSVMVRWREMDKMDVR